MSGPVAPPRSDLLVVAPLRIEARALRRAGTRLRVVRSGMGPDRARRCAAVIERDPARHIVVSGLCGALDADLAPGDVVIASELRTAEQRVPLRASASLRSELERRGLRARFAPLACVPHLVRGAERRVWRSRGARAVDMESAWLADGALARPVTVLRVVLDGPGHELLRPAVARDLLHALRALAVVGRALLHWTPDVTAAPSSGAPSPRAMGDL